MLCVSKGDGCTHSTLLLTCFESVLSECIFASTRTGCFVCPVCVCRYISLVIVQSDVFSQDHHSLTYTNGEPDLCDQSLSTFVSLLACANVRQQHAMWCALQPCHPMSLHLFMPGSMS